MFCSYLVSRVLAAEQSKFTVVLLAMALGLSQFLRAIILYQVKHFMSLPIILHLDTRTAASAHRHRPPPGLKLEIIAIIIN